METAFAWIGQIVAWFGQFIPRLVILDPTQGAIKYKRGKNPIALDAGLHVYWPLVTTFEIYPTARQTDRLETQVMETKDGKTFLVSGTLTYAVEDISKLLPFVAFPTRNTIDVAMTALHDVCCDFDWAELQSEQRRGTLKTKLRNEAQHQLGEYGIKVVKLQLNTLARCRVLKVSQSTASEEN
jgi:regulator of protease activity HflC (stomatin/prohibitin superfamily)